MAERLNISKKAGNNVVEFNNFLERGECTRIKIYNSFYDVQRGTVKELERFTLISGSRTASFRGMGRSDYGEIYIYEGILKNIRYMVLHIDR